MRNDDAKLNRIRNDLEISDGLGEYVTEEEVKQIRDALYRLLDEINNPSELHIHTRIAEGITEQMKKRIITLGDQIYAYNNKSGVWDTADEMINAVTEAIYVSSGTSRNEVNAKIAIWTRKKRKGFDEARKRFIGFMNGAWDIENWKFVPHAKEHCLLSSLPVEYSEAAECPNISKFLSEIAYPADVKVLEEWAGYCMIDEIFIHQALMLHGKGNNGKSVLIGLLKSFLGEENTTSISLHKLAESYFAAADLYGKKANLYADLSHEALKDTGPFKILVGGDQITGERKFKDQFNFSNTSKQIFSANNIPRTSDITDGFFRRWCIVHFPHEFSGKAADKHLLKKLITLAELSGFLNLALSGLKRIYENQDFSRSESADEVRMNYLRLSDSISAFAQECVENDLEAMRLPKEQWAEAYFSYCRQNKILAVSSDLFFKTFPKLVPLQERRIEIDGERERVWGGIKLRENKIICQQMDLKGVVE